ncbi:MAG: transglycosylase SLT domain-containing protein [Polyangiales bacterium]
MTRRVVLTLALLTSIPGAGVVLGWNNGANASPRHPSAKALDRAMQVRLGLRPHSQVEPLNSPHCQEAPQGCAARIAALSQVITQSSLAHRVDPFLTAAISWVETRWDPEAVGTIGERGIIQLHPRFAGKKVRFVSDPKYRERCLRRADACQREVLNAGLSLYNWAKKKCGNTEKALGWYNTGKCIKSDFSQRVLRERRELLRLAKLPDETSAN